MEAVKHISPRAEQLISEYGLGHVRAEYQENLLKTGLILTALLPVGLAAVALTLPTLFSPSLTDGNWWEQLGNLSGLFLFGSCFALMGVLGLIILIMAIWQGEKRLYLGDKGFVSTRRQVEMAVRWETVSEIHRHMLFTKGKSENVQRVKSTCSYKIVPVEGKKCSITAEPGPVIEQAVTAYQLPRALGDYANGKTLSFGWLTLGSEGLHLTLEVGPAGDPTSLTKLPGVARTSQKLLGTCVESGEHFLPWEQLSCYWIDESRSTLILSRQGQRKHWAIVPLFQVANPALCLALIEHVCYGETRESA